MLKKLRAFIAANERTRFEKPNAGDLFPPRERAGFVVGDEFWLIHDALAGIVAPMRLGDAIKVLHRDGLMPQPKMHQRRVGPQQRGRFYIIKRDILTAGLPDAVAPEDDHAPADKDFSADNYDGTGHGDTDTDLGGKVVPLHKVATALPWDL